MTVGTSEYSFRREKSGPLFLRTIYNPTTCICCHNNIRSSVSLVDFLSTSQDLARIFVSKTIERERKTKFYSCKRAKRTIIIWRKKKEKKETKKPFYELYYGILFCIRVLPSSRQHFGFCFSRSKMAEIFGLVNCWLVKKKILEKPF